MFASIQKALAQMVKFKLPEDQVQICNTQYSLSHCNALLLQLIGTLQVEEMRECLLGEGWKRSSSYSQTPLLSPNTCPLKTSSLCLN